MIDANVPGASGWWNGLRSIPAGRWGLLLAVQAVVTVLVDALILTGSFTAMLVLSGLVTAGAWYAVLRILLPGTGLRPDLRRLPLLWAWLVVLDVTGLLNLRFDADVFVPAYLPALASLADLGLRYLFALLPMVVLLDGRGPLHACRLVHRSWRTVVPVAAVVLLGFMTEQVSRFVLAVSRATPGEPGGLAVLLTGNLLFAVARAVLITATLYVTYRLATADEPLPA